MGAMAGAAEEQVEPTCPNGHVLKRRKADAEYECDVCSSDISEGRRMFVCKKCDYSVCLKCHKRLAEDAAAEAALAEDKADEEQLFELFCEVSSEPVQDGRRLKYRCIHCSEKCLTESGMNSHLQTKHRAEFEEFK